jgi:opacity protein-like surface antigen
VCGAGLSPARKSSIFDPPTRIATYNDGLRGGDRWWSGESVSCIVLAIAAWLAAASAAAQEPAQFDWRGAYTGAHIGGALALVDVGDPFGPSIFGDTVRTPGALVGGQLGYNWQRTTSANVNFGGEGEIVPMRCAAEQAQVLVQGTYKFSDGRK